MEHLNVIIDDMINGYCPQCPAPDIQFANSRKAGNNGGYTELHFLMWCSHFEVCRHRSYRKAAKVVE